VRLHLHQLLSLAAFVCLLSVSLSAQDSERPIPILTGNMGFIASGAGQERELAPQINPVLLLPLGNKWLIEGRAEFEGEIEREEPGDPFRGSVNK
jgi:hypothetical protein